MEKEWMPPKAVVIPKDNKELEMGRYGPIFPKTLACYGFTMIADVKQGRAEAVRNYGNTLGAAMLKTPYMLSTLKLHYLRWVLFDN
ncbi:MAG: hypothetical protein ABI462_14205, partial [Ignavibacteria bacterium]